MIFFFSLFVIVFMSEHYNTHSFHSYTVFSPSLCLNYRFAPGMQSEKIEIIGRLDPEGEWRRFSVLEAEIWGIGDEDDDDVPSFGKWEDEDEDEN